MVSEMLVFFTSLVRTLIFHTHKQFAMQASCNSLAINVGGDHSMVGHHPPSSIR